MKELVNWSLGLLETGVINKPQGNNRAIIWEYPYLHKGKWWRWRESNPRPSYVHTWRLHAYLLIYCRY